jgi:hypothetical protein
MCSRLTCQDDKLTLNTQIGSQWDGLRHWGFDDGRFYNGLTQADIYSKKTSRLGIHGEPQCVQSQA